MVSVQRLIFVWAKLKQIVVNKAVDHFRHNCSRKGQHSEQMLNFKVAFFAKL